MDEKILKKKLLDSCNAYVNNRIEKLNQQIKSIEESLRNETKSSAGDKHETGRAMVQLEREKLGKQLLEAEKLYQIVKKTHIDSISKAVRLGSLVITPQANYFMGISIGKIEVENIPYFVIAPDTPIGKLLMGKKIGDEIIFNDKPIRIEKVF